MPQGALVRHRLILTKTQGAEAAVACAAARSFQAPQARGHTCRRGPVALAITNINGVLATGPTGCAGRTGGAATSTAPAKPTNAGTPTPRQHRDQ